MDELLSELFKRQPELLNQPLTQIPGAKIGMMPALPKGALGGLLGKLLGRKPPVQPPIAPPSDFVTPIGLGPEYTPVGGEAAFNAGRGVTPTAKGADGLVESIYQRLLKRGGR